MYHPFLYLIFSTDPDHYFGNNKPGMTKQEKINELLAKVDLLLKRQDEFSKEIDKLRVEINRLRASESIPLKQDALLVDADFEAPLPEFNEPKSIPTAPQAPIPPPRERSKIRLDLEKFIGENLINKVGIAITIIGVAIGAKYSIDNNLISPLTRILLGYLAGLSLLGIGIRLKKNYANYSAVLVSGAMAILYFITYFAYSYYGLIHQILAFALMVVFTAFTTMAALRYDRQVIAHIGLVGAYAVPYLLGGEGGNVAVLFVYMAIINIGILIIAFKKYWKLLFYAAAGFTWVIYFLWYVSEYHKEEPLGLAFGFLCLFFAIFYLTFIAYKTLQKEEFAIQDILLLLGNSFIFYGIGFDILDNHAWSEPLLGLFTVANGVIHALVSVVIYRQQLVDKKLFYFILGLAIVFMTIAIPVQLDGSWVTLLWVGEAALLFWIGRTKNIAFYERLSYPLLFLAFISLCIDWAINYDGADIYGQANTITPLLNINFLSSALFIAAVGFMNYLNLNKQYTPTLNPDKWWPRFAAFSVPSILLMAIYFAFQMEIVNYWDQIYAGSRMEVDFNGYPTYQSDKDISRFKAIWMINYSLIFFSILAIVNMLKIKSRLLTAANLILILFALIAFLSKGILSLSELQHSYLNQSLAEYYPRGPFHIIIRYISLLIVAGTLFMAYRLTRQPYFHKNAKAIFECLLHGVILILVSSELIYLMDFSNSEQSYKLGLSILWGIYALFLIILGIWKHKKYLRIAAIVLFGVTLVKLFFYDISHLGTVPKTIVLVSLGVLLLIVSFLYNRFREVIAENEE